MRRLDTRRWLAAARLGAIVVFLGGLNLTAQIDSARATVLKKYSLSPCDGPSGLAIDTKNRRLFSVCSNRIMAISDPDAGKVIATPAIGAGCLRAGDRSP